MNQNCKSGARIKSGILFLFLLVYPVWAQTSENYAESIPDYVYGLGKGVGDALATDCPAALASIEEVKVNQSPVLPKEDEYKVRFSVIEYYRFQGDRKKADREINLSFRRPRVNKIPLTGRPSQWYLIFDPIEGDKAMIFNCKSGNRFVTTDAAYFGRIRQAIELTERFRADYVNALDYFAKDYETDDELRKAAALNFLFTGPRISLDVIVYILVDLLNAAPISKQREGWAVKADIRARLSRDGIRDAPAEFRTQSFIKLVRIADGENENAIDATEILAQIARFNPDELRPYLKSGKTGNIGTNLKKIRIPIGDESLPEALMKMLSEK